MQAPNRAILLAAFALLGCPQAGGGGGGEDADLDGDASDGDTTPPSQTTAAFSLAGDLDEAGMFYDHPYPSDLRLTAEGAPALAGLPNPLAIQVLSDLVTTAMAREGFPQVPVAWFRFDDALAAHDFHDVVPADPGSPVLLVDIDGASNERGRLIPTVLQRVPPDRYVEANVLGVAARPGFVLDPRTTYAFVVMRSLGDARGEPLGVPEHLASLAAGEIPDAPLGEAAAHLFAPLWETLRDLGVDPAEVAAATVFTTGDEVDALYDLSEGVRDAYPADLADLAPLADGLTAYPRFCALAAAIDLPQLQRGAPPFDTEGLFAPPGADGVPPVQRTERAPVVITIPREPMPPGGYPVVVYFHGSGGLSTQVIDRGPILEPGGDWEPGRGPAHVLARRGFAAVGPAMPVNPERLPGAGETDYINPVNLPAFRDTMRQGVLEGRLLLDALARLRIEPELLAGCAGVTLPAGETDYRLATAPVMAMGQSMGAIYANLVSALDPRVEALAPTGAGAFWSHQILISEENVVAPVLRLVLSTDAELTFFHPVMHAMQTAWEPVEPLVYLPRLSRAPLDGHPARAVYQPAGLGDTYYPIEIYDAMALAFGHPQAGDEVWPGMQEALALAGLQGILAYPVTDNLTSAGSGLPYTGVVVQYAGDGVANPHTLFSQLDEVKYQYGCFFRTYLDTGSATLFAPSASGEAAECGAP